MFVAILGLGEAGSRYAQDLSVAGTAVTAFDPVVSTTLDGVDRATSVASAVTHADLVLSMVGGDAAVEAARASFPAMKPEALFADMNTMAPDVKSALADIASSAGVHFVDVAIMAPVPRAGAATRLLAAGPGAQRFADHFPIRDAPIQIVGQTAGASAELKLLRSVFMKGLAALVFESVAAAEHSGSRDWMVAEIASELGGSGEQLVERLIDGTTTHAARREHEMVDAQKRLDRVGSPSWMTRGTIQWLHQIASEH
ncbi:MAG TPA: NAD(P)-binding domain-containing protein [Microbacteriaceae bacterium]|jgi:3-hydroxyisobutyrate dehydrogenase-like beta-hydroxyacid dehydrogenase|nr:NAD(P)-binding domain-containing protein [Microbacteriaceae bacterium]